MWGEGSTLLERWRGTVCVWHVLLWSTFEPLGALSVGAWVTLFLDGELEGAVRVYVGCSFITCDQTCMCVCMYCLREHVYTRG